MLEFSTSTRPPFRGASSSLSPCEAKRMTGPFRLPRPHLGISAGVPSRGTPGRAASDGPPGAGWVFTGSTFRPYGRKPASCQQAAGTAGLPASNPSLLLALPAYHNVQAEVVPRLGFQPWSSSGRRPLGRSITSLFQTFHRIGAIISFGG